LALTTTNTRIQTNNFNHHSRKETFPINHIRQQQQQQQQTETTNSAPYLKI